MINSFRDKYRFLSNFYPCRVNYFGTIYNSSEHAYMAAKTHDVGWKWKIVQAQTPGQAKRLGRQAPLRPDWEQLKFSIMSGIVFAKFHQNPDLLKLLLETGDQELVEGNTWGDTVWGVCDGKGTNWLGIILMRVRKHFQEKNNAQNS